MRSTVSILLLAMAGCQGGWHTRGERRASGRVSVGIPSGGNLLWAGEKSPAPNVGATVAVEKFVRDRVALIGGLTPYRYYDQEDGPVHAHEIFLGARYFAPVEFRLGKVRMGVFLDASLGAMQSSKSIPEAGTDTNITQESGIGLEAHMGENISLVAGYHQRHISNGGGNASQNPGYNDHQVFLGLTWRW